MWVFSIYFIVDGFFVSKFVGEKALSAVNIVLPFISFLLAVAICFAIGTQTIIGISLGKKEYKKANSIFSFMIISLFLISIVISFICHFKANLLIKFLSGGRDNNLALDYLKCLLYFAPFYIIAYIFEVLVKIDSFPKLAVVVALISAFSNIFLDYIFLSTFNLGIKGAAIATGFSQFIASVIYFVHFALKRGKLHFVKFKNHFKLYPRILFIGAGDFLSELSTGIIVYLYNYFLYKKIGLEAIIVFTIINYISQISTVTMQGISQGIQPLVSYYYGRGDRKYIEFLKYAFLSSAIFSIFFFLASNIFAYDILKLFLTEVNSFDISSFRLYSPFFLVIGANILIIGFFASIAKAKSAIFISLLRSIIIIAPVLCIITSKYIFLSSFITEIITLIFSLFLVARFKQAL